MVDGTERFILGHGSLELFEEVLFHIHESKITWSVNLINYTMGKITANLETLKRNPSGRVIHDALLSVDQENLDLDAVMIMVKYVVQIHPSLQLSTKGLLLVIASKSFLFLVQVVNFINLLKDAKESKIYKEFLVELLTNEQSALFFYIDTVKNKFELNLVKSMFFGSKIFNAISDELDVLQYLSCMKCQFQCVIEKTNCWDDKSYADLLVSFLSLHPVYSMDVVFGELLFKSSDYFTAFKSIFQSGSSISQKRLFNRYMFDYFEKLTNLKNSSSVYLIFSQIGADNVDFHRLIQIRNLYLKRIIVRLLSQRSQKDLATFLLDYFQRRELSDDLFVCELLTMVLRELPKEEKDVLSHASVFLDAVTGRLSNEDTLVRERTMFIAKLVTNGELDYVSDFVIEIPDFKIPSDSAINFTTLRTGNTKSLKTAESAAVEVQKLTLTDSDDEEEQERDIVFLKDLVQEFEHCSKNNLEHLRLLKLTVKLLRQKKDSPMEAAYYSSSLLSSITSLSNNLSEPTFEEWRINALVSVLAIVPDKVVDLSQLLFNGDFSLQQRMAILSAMALAARELRGLDDSFVVKPEYDFPTKRLPWDENTTDNQLVRDSSNDSAALEGRVIWKSKKLNAPKEPRKENRFKNFATKFFYPLAHGWLNGIDLGAHDALFKKHYLTTLKAIISAAYPSHEFEAMSLIMSQILDDAYRQGIHTDIRQNDAEFERT